MDIAGLVLRRGHGWDRRTTQKWSARLRRADKLGRAVAWLASSGRLPVLLLFVPLVAVLLLAPGIVTLPFAWSVVPLGYAALLMLGWALWGAHMRVVIEAFDDYRPTADGATTGTEEDKDDARAGRKDAGSAVLLANRLAAMRELYAFVDDPDETPGPGKTTGATVQLDDAGSVLRSAVTTNSTVSLGPVSVPLGAIMGLLGRFVQAPRLRGAIHGGEGELVVTAELMMEGQPYSWRVPARVENGTPPAETLDVLIGEELAYQVFSDLTLQRQARWPATRHWLDALEKTAECQRRPRNRRLLLKAAESKFTEALAEDERFYLACLNLGIVNRRLGEHTGDPRASDPRDRQERERAWEDRRQRYVVASRRVFERAIGMQPDRWEAYHALAEAMEATDGSKGALEMIAGLCDRALALEPDRSACARILDLRAHAEEKAAQAHKEKGERDEEAAARRTALGTRERACRLALEELRWTTRRRVRTRHARRLRALEKQASQCLVNLFDTSWEVHRLPVNGERRKEEDDGAAFQRVYEIATLAVQISDIDPGAHVRLADLAFTMKRLDVAVDEIADAARIAPAEPLYAAKLAHALAASEDLGRAREACTRARRMIDFADPKQADAQLALIAAYKALGDDHEKALLEKRLELTKDLEGTRRPTANATARALRDLIDDCGDRRDWERARVQQELGWHYLEQERLGSPQKRGVEAEKLFSKALDWFKREQPDDRRIAMLHSDRARALALQRGRSGEALADAAMAMRLDPLSAPYRKVLAHAYKVGGDLDHACESADDALLLDPDNPDLHFDLAWLRWQRAESISDPVLHADERNEAIEQFEAALRLYDADQRERMRTTHWWLAMSYFAVSEFKDVPVHLRFVFSSLTPANGVGVAERGIEAVTELWLGQTYRKLRKYGEAEHHLTRACEVAERLDATQSDGRRVKLTQSLARPMEDDRWPLGLVMALARMQLAGCHAERDARLREAQSHLAASNAVIERMEDIVALRGYAAEARSDYEAENGRVHLARGRTEKAIKALRASTEADPDEADVYLLLAYAHKQAAQERIEAEWEEHVRHARAACKRTREIGGKGHPDTDFAHEIEAELGRLEARAIEARRMASANGDRPAGAHARTGASD